MTWAENEGSPLARGLQFNPLDVKKTEGPVVPAIVAKAILRLTGEISMFVTFLPGNPNEPAVDEVPPSVERRIRPALATMIVAGLEGAMAMEQNVVLAPQLADDVVRRQR